MIATPATSQSDDGWEVVVFDEQALQIITLSANGIEHSYQLTPPVDRLVAPDNIRVNMSSDRQTAIVHYSYFFSSDDPIYESYIVDLSRPHVGRLIPQPPLVLDEVFLGYMSGAISPDDDAIAMVYRSHDLSQNSGCCNSGGMVVLDIASNALIHHTMRSDSPYSARIDDWTDEGIFVAPNNPSSWRSVEFTYRIWDPSEDQFTDTRRFFNIDWADRLATTGEVIKSNNHPEFPLGGSLSGAPQRNVVELYLPTQVPDEEAAQVVYYDIDNLAFERAWWVIDGSAFLVENHDRGVIVFRDGQQHEFELAPTHDFLSITPDGWLMVDAITYDVFYYQFQNGDVKMTLLADFSSAITIIDATATPQDFPPFEQHIEPPDEFCCRGFLPSRLQAGEDARVIIDDLDYYPLRFLYVEDSGDQMILPYGAVVAILDGPKCGSWEAIWLVEYAGHKGTMLEGTFDTYYLAPVESKAE